MVDEEIEVCIAEKTSGYVFDKILNFRSGENFPFIIYAIGAEIAKTSDSTPIAF